MYPVILSKNKSSKFSRSEYNYGRSLIQVVNKMVKKVIGHNMMKIGRCLGGKMIIWISLVIMLALTGFFYLHIKEDYRHLVMLIKDEACQLSDIIKRSTRQDMLLNKKPDLQQRVDDITNHDGIVKMRIIDAAGRIEIASNKHEIGQLIDKNAEACNECHQGNGPPESSARKKYRIFKNADGQEVMGIMDPIYNETSCYPCHGTQKRSSDCSISLSL